MRKRFLFVSALVLPGWVAAPATAQLTLARADYVDRVQAIWTGQILAVLVALKPGRAWELTV